MHPTIEYDRAMREKMKNAKRSIAKVGKTRTLETRIKISLAHGGNSNIFMAFENQPKEKRKRYGETAPNWKGGISYEPYCPKWNNDLRTRIRAFFEYRCIICGKPQNENITSSGRIYKLSCHHVEYNKQACCDGRPVHFAALCHKHHMETNGSRDKWEEMLHRIIDEIYDGKSYYTKAEYNSKKV